MKSELYNKKYNQEIDHYEQIKNVHNLPEIFHYWSNKYLLEKFKSLGFTNIFEFYYGYISKICLQKIGSTCYILSIGAGNCDMEVSLAQSLVKKNIKNFIFVCLDINNSMLNRGRILAKDKNLFNNFEFLQADIKNWSSERSYDIIIANQSLHHVLELEALFEKIYNILTPKGYFLTVDVIGRNGHMLWPEALEIVTAIWAFLELKYKYNHQLKRFENIYDNWDCSNEGFEGIRCQCILPLLIKKFNFEFFFAFSNIINVFVGRSFGYNFNREIGQDRNIIDIIAQIDDYLIQSGKIKPTQMVAAMCKFAPISQKIYEHMAPEFCVRSSLVFHDRFSIRKLRTSPFFVYLSHLKNKIKRINFY